MSGRAVLEQDGRRVEAPPGGLFLYDTARPYAVHYPERFRVTSAGRSEPPTGSPRASGRLVPARASHRTPCGRR
ncbi:hypothetical protein ACFCVY_13620 [Streptomyces sp. NPDC056411]|uniref:AraC-like ligand-binding domain-containing protein n=1 Tax=Streptomyces sp. NPDC056411 TaxID=3345813 RepID=UPI0035DB673F